KVECAVERLDLRAANLEQRAHREDPVVRRHPGDEVQSASAQHGEEEGLRLIIERMSERDGAEALLATDAVRSLRPDGPRPRLHGFTLSRLRLRRFEVDRKPELGCEATDVRGVLGGVRAQTVIEVEDLELDAKQSPKQVQPVQQ